MHNQELTAIEEINELINLEKHLIITKETVFLAMKVIARNNKRDDFPPALVREVYFAIKQNKYHGLKAQVMNIILMNNNLIFDDLDGYATQQQVKNMRLILPKKTQRQRLAEVCEIDFKLVSGHFSGRLKMPKKQMQLYKQKISIVLNEADIDF